MNVSSPQLQLWLTRHNRSSVAALLGRLEGIVPGVKPRLVQEPGEVAPGILLCSFMTAQAHEMRRELGPWRKRLGNTVWLVAGGPHPSGAPADTLDMGFQWVVRGEAGAGFDRLMQRLLAGQPPDTGGVVSGGRRGGLDAQRPWPWSGTLYCPIELTRGCPERCAFCQTPRLHGRRPRHRSLEALDPLFVQARKTGHTFTRFIAPNALAWGVEDGDAPRRRPNLRQLERLFGRLRRRGFEKVFFGNFPSEVRPEWVTEGVVALLAEQVDNRSLVVGVQSGSDDLLRRLRRGHTVRDGVDAVALIARAGLTPWVDFIFGLPGETEADRDATRALVHHLTDAYDARIDIHLFTPLPGTPLASAPAGQLDRATETLIKQLVGRGNAAGHHVS